MPLLLKHIDQIARKKQRDVLLPVFKDKNVRENDIFSRFDCESHARRKECIQWLDEQKIHHEPCFRAFSEGWISMPYLGDIFIDVPFDESDENFKKLTEHFENEDGSMKYDDVTFSYYPLERALKNKHCDEPGFWDKYIEDF